jgi:hypothetical protein
MKKQMRHVRQLRAAAGMCLLLGAAAAASAVVPPTASGVDIPSRFGAGSLIATQTVPTGFGDNKSELDQLFVKSDPSYLNIAITGNIENNGNGVLILLDTKDGGSSAFNYTGGDGSGRIYELNGDTLDSDFAPDYAVDMNNSGGTLYVDLYDLQANTKTYLGNATDGGGLGSLTGGGGVAFSNQNAAGVTDSAAVDAGGYPLAAGASTGVEIDLPLSQIGDPAARVRAMAVIIGSGGFVSNQVLPGLPDTTGNLGNGPTNYQNIPGEQNASIGIISGSNELPAASVPWAYTPVYLSGSGNNDAHPPVTSTPTVFNGIAYVAEDVVDGAGIHTGNIVAIDTTSAGTARLASGFGTNGRITGLDGPVVGRVAVYYSSGVAHLYAMTVKGTLYIMDAGTGANLHPVPVFPGGTSTSTPAAATVDGLPVVIVAGKAAGGDVQLVKVLDLAVPIPTPPLTLVGATDVASSPSIVGLPPRIQIATINGGTGGVFSVDASSFTVFNMAPTAGPVYAAPTLTTSPPGTMLLGDANAGGSLLYAFNASNANLIWAMPSGGTVRNPVYVDYHTVPNAAFVATDTGILDGVSADIGAPLPGFPAAPYPDATGSVLLLHPTVALGAGTLYIPTTDGMRIASTSGPAPSLSVRYPVPGALTTPSATGPGLLDILAATSDIGAGPAGTAGPTGFTGGNVYGLAVQAAPSAP